MIFRKIFVDLERGKKPKLYILDADCVSSVFKI